MTKDEATFELVKMAVEARCEANNIDTARLNIARIAKEIILRQRIKGPVTLAEKRNYRRGAYG